MRLRLGDARLDQLADESGRQRRIRTEVQRALGLIVVSKIALLDDARMVEE